MPAHSVVCKAGTLAAKVAISGAAKAGILNRLAHERRRARHHGRNRCRARADARGVPAAAPDPGAYALTDRAWHLLGHVERTLLLQVLARVAEPAADQR